MSPDTPEAPSAIDPRGGLLFIVSAPSGGGKTSLVSALLKDDPQLVVSVSHTTRKRRASESDGVNYHFVDTDTFQRMSDDQAFLEHAEVFGNRYGTSKDAVSRELDQGRDVILEIDWQGARLVREHYPEAISIFILPPSRETLTQRLEGRGQDDPAVIAERTRQAREEMAHHGDYGYLVVNDQFGAALDDLLSIVHSARLGTKTQRQSLKTLLAELLKES